MIHSVRPLVIGTRSSALAQAQTGLVVAAIRDQSPHMEIQVRHIHTQGDRDQTSSLREIGGQGVFVRAIESSLLEGKVDLAVHSLKDMPSISPPGLKVAALLPREDPRDALISRDNHGLAELYRGASVGTSSMRRQVQLLKARPDLSVQDLRGNVDTRLRKLWDGAYDAIVLALAGLRRLGMEDAISEILPPEVMLPAPGQGAIAVQTRADDLETREIVSFLDDLETRYSVTAERAFLRTLGSGCRAAVAAYGILENGVLFLRGLLGKEGEGSGAVLCGQIRGPKEDADELGVALAREFQMQLSKQRGKSRR